MNDQVIEATEIEYPLASFIGEYGKTARDFVSEAKHLRRRHFPEHVILRHATFLSHYVAVSDEIIQRLNLNILPFQGSDLEYIGSNSHAETLWVYSPNNHGAFSIAEDVLGSLNITHTSFTKLDAFKVWKHCMELVASRHTSVWDYAIEIIALSNTTHVRYLKSGFRTNGWGIVAVSTEDRYADVYNFLKDNYGAPVIYNGWYQESLSIGNANIQYILAQLLYSEQSPDSITDIAFKLYQRFEEG